MYLIAATKMAVCLVDIIDDDVSQVHCVSNCSSTKTVASSNLSQHILTMFLDKSVETFYVSRGNVKFSIAFIWTVVNKKRLLSLPPQPMLGLGKVKFT